MKIKRFVGRNVNNYLNFDVAFFDQLTFVTGINGSGKTSVLNSIAALLLPRLDYLAEQDFDEIRIEVTDDDNFRQSLSARKSDSLTILTCTQFPEEVLEIPVVDELESVPPHRVQEYEEEYYTNILARNKDNPILNFIKGLPTPIYLGLDRRSLSIGGSDRARYGARTLGRRRTRRNLFGQSLAAGLTEALFFAREQFQSDRRREISLDERFRQGLVADLIDFPILQLSGKFHEPSETDLKTIRQARTTLERLPRLLAANSDVILARLNSVFDFLNSKLEIIRSSPEDSDERTIALVEWSYNKANLDKISRLSERISKYTGDVDTVRRHRNDYLETVNSFLQDSGKTISFNNIGELRFQLDREDDDRHLSTLSSGEIQLVVILTHLYFNPEVAEANVFIIDEPELSLHVQWQEKFVAGIVNASSATQFILATHSPSIILDRTDLCIEVSQQ